MPGGRGSIRGDVNVILNGLIADGVITGFETNFDNPISSALALHVRVTANVITDHRNPRLRRETRSLDQKQGRERHRTACAGSDRERP